MGKPALYPFITWVLFCTFAVSCSDSGESGLRKAISVYKKDPSPATVSDIGNAAMAMSAAASFKHPFPVESGNALVIRDKDGITTVYPFKRTIDGGEDTVILATDPSDRTIAVAHPDGLVLYTGRNSRKIIPSTANPVRAACRLDDDTILFLSGNALFRHSLSKDSTSPFMAGEKFPPPFQGGFYRATLLATREHVLIVAGVAGRYNMSLLSMAGPSVIFKNRQLASPRLAFTENAVMCVTGSPGTWTITRISIDGKSTQTLLRLSHLADIALFPEGILYEENDSLHALPRGIDIARTLPFGWRLAGQAGPTALVEHDGRLHALDTARLFTALRLIESETPEVLKH
ncbi:MAG: hypothetical protein AB2L13_11850 [Spirochaetota bacterium]